MSLPGMRAAATSSGAAAEKSPGTTTSPSRSAPTGSTVTVPARRRTRTPAASSSSSVWSRVATRSTTVVAPLALRPARRTADLTWALATSGSNSMPRSPAEPRTTSGAWPSVVSTPAPIRRSGSAIRSIGRPESDASPRSVNSPSWPAATPARSRMSVPEFAQSTAPGRSPRSPTPRTTSSSSATSSTSTPSSRTASRVACVSPERPKPRTRVSPSPSAPRRTARWEIDLSPGTATWPTTATAGSTFTASTDGASHEGRESADLVRELAELGGRDLLRGVAERLLRPRMDLDDDPVGAGRDRGARERQDELTAARRMGRVDDHGQVRLLLEHGDRADVEREPCRRLERLDAALAEDHLGVPLLDDVLGRHEEVLDRRRRAALQQHGLRRPADLGEEREVRHVARADLDDVDRIDDRLDVARIHELGDERQTGLVAGLLENLERLLAEPLEGVGRRARLEGAAAEHRHALGGDRARRLERLLARLHRARACDEAEVAVADPAAAHLDHRRVRGELAGDELVRLEDRQDLLDAGEALERQRREQLPLADRADHGRLPAG